MDADVIVIGAGLAGLVAADEAANRGRKVLLLDQEGPQSLGGQAFWSLGGLFMIDTPEQPPTYAGGLGGGSPPTHGSKYGKIL